MISLLLILFPAFVFAASEHGEHGAPTLDEHTIKTIIYQAINVAMLVGGLVYFLKDGIRTFFVDKQKAFLAHAEKAEAARRAAEQEHMQIKVQLTKLESTADETLSRARAEAADMRNQIIADAQAMSKRIHEEAQTAAHNEFEKARAALRHDLIQQASILAEQSMKNQLSREDHQRLQGDFIHNIEAVQS